MRWPRRAKAGEAPKPDASEQRDEPTPPPDGLRADEDKAQLEKEELQKQLNKAVEQLEKERLQSRQNQAIAQSEKADLMNRLNNAVAQRNAAREEALMLEAKLKQLQDDMQSGRLAPVAAAGGAAAAAAAAASAGMVTPPPAAAAAAAGDEGMMDRMRRFMQQIPGTSPMGTPMATPSGRLEGPSTEPLSEMDQRQRDLYAKQQQLLREQRTADQEKLLSAIGSNLGFHQGRPVAALLIFRCCLQWKTFEADRTPLFDRIIATMGSQVELYQEDNAMLAYWLSNTVTLLYLMQKNVKPASGGGYAERIKASSQQVTRGLFGSTKGGSFTSFFSRTGFSGGSPGQSMEASIHSSVNGCFRQVEAKYPALLFKQQLDAFVQKIYPMLRDNMKKEISPQLAACIHAPRQTGARSARRTTSGEAAGGLSPQWASMLRVLDSLLATLRENHVPPFLVQKLFEQLLSFVNVQLFNQLLLRRECCSVANGQYVKAQLSEVEQWISAAGEEWVGTSWAELAHIRQATDFLVIPHKHLLSFRGITEDLCGSLSVQQLYRISTMYWDDRYNTVTVSPEVLAQMKTAMQESSSSAASHYFLLEDDKSIPFSHADVERMVDDAGMLGETPVPKQLRGEQSFSFLRKPLEMALAVQAAGASTPGASRQLPSLDDEPPASIPKHRAARTAAAGTAGTAPTAGRSARHAEAVEALKSAAVQRRLPVVAVQLGPAASSSLSIPLASWLLCESLIRWADTWQPGEVAEAADTLQRAIVDETDAGGLEGQAYWLACSLAAGGLLKFRTVGRREYSHLLRLSDALINCTPVHEALGDSIAETVPVSVAVLLSEEAKRAAQQRGDAPGASAGHSTQSPWRALLGGVSNVLEALRAEGVPAPAVRAVSWACLRYIDAELLNALLLRRDCCSASAAKALQAGLAELRGWVAYVGGEWCCSPEEAETAIERVTQAACFLAQGKDYCIQKASRGVDIVADLARSCPALSLQQVYRLAEHQHEDGDGSEGALDCESIGLLEALNRLMAEQRARMCGTSSGGRAAAQPDSAGANPLYCSVQEEEDDGASATTIFHTPVDRVEEEESSGDAPNPLYPGLSDEEEEDLLVEPREAFVLPWRVLTEAARCFVQPRTAPTGSTPTHVTSPAPVAATPSAFMPDDSPLRRAARSAAPRLPDGSKPAAASRVQPAMSTLVLMDAIGQACLNAELPGELRGHPEFAFLREV